MLCHSCGVAELRQNAPRSTIDRITLHTSRDVVMARQTVARILKTRGASAIRITRFATAVSEIARNAIVHGGGGEMTIGIDQAQAYLIVECNDTGGGIADLAQAMTDGFTTAGGLGRGLGGAKRLSDIFEIGPGAGGGTRITMGVRL